MDYYSILFRDAGDRRDDAGMPDFFGDLNLDQVVGAITAGRDEYDLKPFFHAPLGDVDAIKYRHEVLRDLENEALLGRIKAFAQAMRTMRERLAQAARLYYERQKQWWFLDAVTVYCDAMRSLVADLNAADLRSRGLSSFRDFVADYAAAAAFTALEQETRAVAADLASVRYTFQISGMTVKVRRFEDEIDYSGEVEATFEKFKQGAVRENKVKFRDSLDMNHVEARILDLVALHYPQVFQRLADFCAKAADYLEPKISAFDREVQFYIACLEYVRVLEHAGLRCCYPEITDFDKEIYARDGFDAALARKLVAENSPVVCNGFSLSGPERILVVSGPNQGGKTTFARTFGQLAYLASIGALVPAAEAKLFLFDRLFTHFERVEDLSNLRGKLEDDLVRIRGILEQATPRSIIIANEIFASTTLEDAVFLATRVMERMMKLDLLGVCVTFLVELASLSEKTVSMVSSVRPDDPATRTYKIERRPADGLSYAIALAEKHGLTYHRLKERIAS